MDDNRCCDGDGDGDMNDEYTEDNGDDGCCCDDGDEDTGDDG
jgi:hypothetical protein